MSSRLVNRLIDQIRRQTENEDVTSSTGITDAEFLQFINDAQHRLQSLITSTHPTVFTNERELDVIVDQEAYDIPSDALMKNKLLTVEYSPSGAFEDYYHLEPTRMKRRDTAVQGFPVTYIRRSGKILLQPRPQQAGLLRVNYVKRLWELDKRRGVVQTAVTDDTARTITSLQLDASSSSPALDVSSLNEHNYICIVDRDGNMKMQNIPFESIDAATGVVTLSAGFTFKAGESIAPGDYVCGGRDASTHSELPRMCERYLIAYCAWKILKRDSSIDSSEQQAELAEMESDIVNSFADISDDVTYVPQLNHWSDWSD